MTDSICWFCGDDTPGRWIYELRKGSDVRHVAVARCRRCARVHTRAMTASGIVFLAVSGIGLVFVVGWLMQTMSGPPRAVVLPGLAIGFGLGGAGLLVSFPLFIGLCRLGGTKSPRYGFNHPDVGALKSSGYKVVPQQQE